VPDVGDHGRWDSIGPAQPECEEGGGAFIDAGLQAQARTRQHPGRHSQGCRPAAGNRSTRRRQSKPLQALQQDQRSLKGSRLRSPLGPHLFQDGVIMPTCGAFLRFGP